MSDNQKSTLTSQNNNSGLNQLGLGVCVIDAGLSVRMADDIVSEITSYTTQELTDLDLVTLIPSQQQVFYQNVLQRFVKGEQDQVEIPIIDKNQLDHWILLTSLDRQNDQVRALVQNITATVHRSQERMNAMTNAISDTIIIVNRKKEVVELYPSQAMDISSDDARGRALRDGIVTEDMADEVIYYIDRTLDTKRVQAFEFHSFISEEETRFYDIRIAPINDNEALVLIREITDLKRVQEELSTHIEDLTILRQVDAELADKLKMERATQLGLDAMMRLSNARSGFVALLEAEQLKLVHIIGAYSIPTITQYLERHDTLVAEVLKTRQPIWLVGEELKQHPIYEPLIERTVALIIMPLILHNRLIGIVNLETINAEDFTYESFEFLQLMVGRIAVSLENARLVAQINWQLEEQQRLYEEVSRLEQIKTDMIRIASHDLRNPLAAILGYLEMLNWDFENLSETHQGYIKNIDEAARRMQKITSDILSLERIEETALHKTSENFDLNNLIQQTYNEHRPSAQLKKHNYLLELPGYRVVVDADPIQLHEAIANLVSNALKYTPNHGEVKLTLDVVGNTARVRIIDNGFGIPEEKQERLFQPFYRAKTQETESIQGTGLGLHLVKNIVERFGGTLVYKSTYQQGSTFGFDMPLSADASDFDSDVVDDIDGSIVVG